MLALQSCFGIEFGVALVFDSHTIFDDLDCELVPGFLIVTRVSTKKSKGQVDAGN